MALGGRICPYCKRYTAKDEPRCIYCNQFLGPQWVTEAMKILNSNGLVATNLIAGACVIMFFVEVAMTVATAKTPPSPMSFLFFRGISGSVLDRLGALSTDAHEPWRLLASCFLHMGAAHLLMNMWALYDFARALEPSIKWPRFFVSFVVTGIIGFAVSEWWYGQKDYLTAGASGAVFGVQGLLLGDFLSKKDPRFQQFLWRTIIYSAIFYYAIGTNQAAHMGGLAAGIGIGFLFGKESRPWYREKYFKAAAFVCMLLIVVTFAFIVKNAW